MNLLRNLICTLPLLLIISCNSNSKRPKPAKLDIVFQEDASKFTASQKQRIHDVILLSEKEVRNLLPNLPTGIKVIVEIVDWDLQTVGGVTGRTETNSPPLVLIQISEKYQGGIEIAVNSGLKATIFHEFHQSIQRIS